MWPELPGESHTSFIHKFPVQPIPAAASIIHDDQRRTSYWREFRTYDIQRGQVLITSSHLLSSYPYSVPSSYIECPPTLSQEPFIISPYFSYFSIADASTLSTVKKHFLSSEQRKPVPTKRCTFRTSCVPPQVP